VVSGSLLNDAKLSVNNNYKTRYKFPDKSLPNRVGTEIEFILHSKSLTHFQGGYGIRYVSLS